VVRPPSGAVLARQKLILVSVRPPARFDSTRQTISKHIKILEECSLATSQQKGREIYYYVEPKKLKAVADWIEPFRQMWEDRFSRSDKILPKMK
jgi:DNA-binding transcriptional ArsR family regulator